MSGFTVPNAVNYSSPLNAVPLDWTSSPVEGPKGIQCSIAWGTQGGPNNAVYVNCQNNATLNFSKIRALIIDNSRCGADVEFIFPDTETTVSVPAYTPYAIIPIFTNQTQFYSSCPNAQSEDITNFTILNTAPPPVAVPTTQEQNFYSIGNLNVASASGSLQVVSTDISGTLEGISISGWGQAASGVGAATQFTIKDGDGNSLWEGLMYVAGNGFNNIVLTNLTDIRLRFQKGLEVSWVTSGGPPSMTMAVNLYYRTP